MDKINNRNDVDNRDRFF